jgi:TonB family protein
MRGSVPSKPCLWALALCVLAACAQQVAPELIPLVSADGRAVDEPARRLSCRPAAYPLELREVGVEGAATLEFIIDTTGRVDSTSIRVVAADLPAFARAARQALQTCRFAPARAAGRPARMRARSVYRFAAIQ